MYSINSVDPPIKVILYRRDEEGGGGGRGVIKVKDSDFSNMHLGSHCC